MKTFKEYLKLRETTSDKVADLMQDPEVQNAQQAGIPIQDALKKAAEKKSKNLAQQAKAKPDSVNPQELLQTAATEDKIDKFAQEQEKLEKQRVAQ